MWPIFSKKIKKKATYFAIFRTSTKLLVNRKKLQNNRLQRFSEISQRKSW